MMKRRRFLTLAAAFACAPSLSHADTWSGRALGADVSVTLHGPREMTQKALADVPRLLKNFEQTFSLYQPTSSVSKLNMMGRLRNPNATSDQCRDANHREKCVQHFEQALQTVYGVFRSAIA